MTSAETTTSKPYLEDGLLHIPLDAEAKYRWWEDGQSVWDTLLQLGVAEKHVKRILNLYYLEHRPPQERYTLIEFDTATMRISNIQHNISAPAA